MTNYVIYQGSTAVPGKPYAVRRFDILRGNSAPVPGPVVGVAATLEEAREFVPPQCGACFARADEDDPAIVESWM